jgi:hypothetical protein
VSKFQVRADSVGGHKCNIFHLDCKDVTAWKPICTIWDHDVALHDKMPPVFILADFDSRELTKLLTTLTTMGATWEQKSNAVHQFLLSLEDKRDGQEPV